MIHYTGLFYIDTVFIRLVKVSNFIFNELTATKNEFVKLFPWFDFYNNKVISLIFANFLILAYVFLGVGVPRCHAGPFLGKKLAGLTIILPELLIALLQHFCSNRYIYDVTASSCM
jgi:hypothetical protein